jgi:hypothetical protein
MFHNSDMMRWSTGHARVIKFAVFSLPVQAEYSVAVPRISIEMFSRIGLNYSAGDGTLLNMVYCSVAAGQDLDKRFR